MDERSTGAPERREPGVKSKGFPPGYDPFALAGSYFHFVPNSFSLMERIANGLLAIALLAYGGLGLLIDDLFIPGRSAGLHLHGTAAWLMFGAIVCGVAVLLALIVDHHDRRNNERHYVLFKRVVSIAAWGFFVASLAWHVWRVVRG